MQMADAMVRVSICLRIIANVFSLIGRQVSSGMKAAGYEYINMVRSAQLLCLPSALTVH